MAKKPELTYNRKRFKYPERYDIEQTLGKFAKREFVEDFARVRGIFITKATRDQLANNLAAFFYDDDDIEEIRDVAYKTSRTESLTGFSVSIEDGEGLVESIRTALVNREFDRDIEVGPITKIKDSEDYTCEVTYLTKKNGRIEFIQEESNTFRMNISKIAEGEFQVVTVGNKSTDDGIAKKIVKKSIRRRGNVISLNVDELKTAQTIAFFDNLGNEGIDGNWKLVEVCQLSFRRGDEDDEDDVVDVSTKDLIGINQAVLDGANLRENNFVKQTEKNGYRFMSMTYRFEHNSLPEIVDVKAEFKLRPKVYVIDVSKFYEVEGPDVPKKEKDMPSEKQYSIKNSIWLSSKRIFKEVKKKK